MKFAGQVKQIKGYSVRLVGLRRSLDDSRVEADMLIRASSAGSESRSSAASASTAGLLMSAGRSAKAVARVAKHRLAARVTVLDIEDRVIAGLLDDLGEIEIEHRVVLAKQHHEADGVAPDFIHDLAKGHELPCPLRHFDRLAGAQQLHKLDDLDVEIGLAVAQRRRPPPACA